MKKTQPNSNLKSTNILLYIYIYKTHTNIIVAFLSKWFESQKKQNIVFCFVSSYIIIHQ